MVDTVDGSVLGTVDQFDAASTPSTSDEDVDLTATTGEETETETGDVSTETSQAQAPVNWEERFKGQQTVANQKSQEAQQYLAMLEQERQARLSYEQQLSRYEQAMYAQQLANSGMTQEQVQQQMQAYQAQRAFAFQQQQLAAAAQGLSQREQVLYQTAEEAARPIAAHQIAEKYKVPMADIIDQDSPAAMIKLAEAIAKARKSTKAQASTANKFEGQGLGSAAVKPTTDLDEAAANFIAEAKRRGFA